MLGIRTWDRMMVGTDKSAELHLEKEEINKRVRDWSKFSWTAAQTICAFEWNENRSKIIRVNPVQKLLLKI